MARGNSQLRFRKVLVGAGNGQEVFDFGAAHPGKRIELKFLQVTTDSNIIVDVYFGVAATAISADTGRTASFGPGHVPATSGANADFNGHGPQSEGASGADAIQTKIKADVAGAPTNVRVYGEYEVFD
jgi:hypothetical protein